MRLPKSCILGSGPPGGERDWQLIVAYLDISLVASSVSSTASGPRMGRVGILDVRSNSC